MFQLIQTETMLEQEDPIINCILDDENDNDGYFDDGFLEPLPLDGPESSFSELASLNAFIMMDDNSDDNIFSNNNSNTNDNMLLPHRTNRRRHVSFDDHPTEIKVPSFACLAERERRGLWYRQAEIEQFRSAAREACRALRQDPTAFPEDVVRGLELRTSLDRQLRKHLALTCILKAQVRYPRIDPCHLAAIADRCTELPRREAVAQGARDYCAVYNPDFQCYWTSSSLPASDFTTTTTSSMIKPLVPVPVPIPSSILSNVADATLQFQQQRHCALDERKRMQLEPWFGDEYQLCSVKRQRLDAETLPQLLLVDQSI